MRYTSISEELFDRVREAGTLRQCAAYSVGELWAWSPDGEGVYWYDSLQDLVANHG